jgi:putative ABC transport system ATP-binding protein
LSNAISLKNITYKYPKQTILENYSLYIKEGDSVFIHGASGRGKSTLLNIMAGVLRPSIGEVTVLNRDLTKLKARQLDLWRSNEIGYIFQQFNLLPYLTGRENIRLPLIISKKKKNSLEEEFESELSRIAKNLNIEEILESYPHQMSVGQQQRIAIARAIIGNPKLIIADEPTSSLDDQRTDEFIKMIIEYKKTSGATLVFVSHDQRLAQYFDRTIEL